MADSVSMLAIFTEFVIVQVIALVFGWLIEVCLQPLMGTLQQLTPLKPALEPSLVAFIPNWLFTLIIIVEIVTIYMLYKQATQTIVYRPGY